MDGGRFAIHRVGFDRSPSRLGEARPLLRAWLLPVNVESVPWQEIAARPRPFIARRVSPTEIDDVMRDVFVRMQRGLSTLRDDERFTSWLFQIARNSVAEHMRTRARHPLSDADLEDEPSVELRTTIAKPRARCRAASMFVAQLESPYREAVTLVELDGLTAREAADMVGISVSSMKSRVQHGREQLRKLFDQCCEIALDARGQPTDFRPHIQSCRSPSCK